MEDSVNTLYAFLKRCKKFSHVNGITSSLKVDKDRSIEDLSHIFGVEVGGIIADIDNSVAEIVDKAIIYYEETGNKKIAEKFKKLI